MTTSREGVSAQGKLRSGQLCARDGLHLLTTVDAFEGACKSVPFDRRTHDRDRPMDLKFIY